MNELLTFIGADVNFYLSDNNLIYTWILSVTMGLLLIEIFIVGFLGIDVSSFIDVDFGFLDFIPFLKNKIPFGIFLILFTVVTSGGALVINYYILSSFNTEIEFPHTILPYATFGFFITKILAIPLSKIIPRDSTQVISSEDMMNGNVTVIEVINENLYKGEYIDEFSTTHFIFIKEVSEDKLEVGNEVIIIGQEEENNLSIVIKV